ncbi:Peptidase S1 domain and Peptidase S1A, chymotrypsin-type family and Trypsin-like cysteine/serine peptidase domain-containing protein [Strongyloides ratti]|uniref:Peptidase S1 domain and Peptidase S1A, chymotrypsin-type family and Trypsin-like cysteine/serine peptidase domain-containing protein n=1 Tax=Strongyloides ratti TaxID=34506 RepID=A0A090LJ97_STRRB|nr:Peptidase S1 domain and Peptidase S1A, chymotrypsin-type family and Trypsin-like cysteine/serine peptidase domain-containing protein [Strongyloides ratti]CEF67615.1 Peptidase S1 domain and Peptidase S1A, chymotrypsin-type family and Trypsin-like cysteine/serine peptidase domain-containing protein [Strongyloides ratti]
MSNTLLVILFLLKLISLSHVTGTLRNFCGKTSNIKKGYTFRDFEGSQSSRIVGGSKALNNSWPWIGQIVNENGTHVCGSTLVGKRFLLTAAHCFGDVKSKNDIYENYSVLLGSNERNKGEKYEIETISIHPYYKRNFIAYEYDIAIIKLTEPVNINKKITPIKISKNPVNRYRVCVVAGWGMTSEDGDQATFLKELQLPVLSNEICNDFMHYRGLVNTLSSFCAGYSDGRDDACKGDSGGPLMCLDNESWEIHGIVSWGVGCAKRGYPGIYTSVYLVKSWIFSEIIKLNSNIENVCL